MSSSFNAIDWIGAREPSLQRFLAHDSQPLLHFALMWNMFEGQLCEASASVPKLREVAELLVQRDLSSHPSAVAFLQFIRERYWENNAVTPRFHALRLRSEQESKSSLGNFSLSIAIETTHFTDSRRLQKFLVVRNSSTKQHAFLLLHWSERERAL